MNEIQNILFLISIFFIIACSLYIGYRIGKSNRRGGQADSAAGSRAVYGTTGDISASEQCAETRRAIEDAIRTNEKTAEVIQKMRDILNNHNGSSSRYDILAAENDEALDIALEH